jgi:rfaE bifunctional protein kinase chain/domain
VVGDAVADQFLHGRIARVSREAPVFIMHHESTETVPGGAGNVAANIASLGGDASISSIIGGDENGRRLLSALNDAGVDTRGVIIDPDITTVTKVRVIAGHQYASRQQVIRIDYLNSEDVAESSLVRLTKTAIELAKDADAVIFSDYGHGSAQPELFRELKDIADQLSIPLTVDSRHGLTQFSGATSATPNQEEVAEILGNDFRESDCIELRRQLDLKALLVTNGNKGMTLYLEDKDPLLIPAFGSSQPVDVTGAGDTVIAAYTLALAAKLPFETAARIANVCGGISVMKKGTSTVGADELHEAIK